MIIKDLVFGSHVGLQRLAPDSPLQNNRPILKKIEPFFFVYTMTGKQRFLAQDQTEFAIGFPSRRSRSSRQSSVNPPTSSLPILLRPSAIHILLIISIFRRDPLKAYGIKTFLIDSTHWIFAERLTRTIIPRLATSQTNTDALPDARERSRVIDCPG